MIVTRRNFVAGCAAGALLPTAACRAAAAGTQVAPEGFGAIGDGVADDYEAFQRMAATVSSTGGGTVTLSTRPDLFPEPLHPAEQRHHRRDIPRLLGAHDRGQRCGDFHQGRFFQGRTDDARSRRLAVRGLQQRPDPQRRADRQRTAHDACCWPWRIGDARARLRRLFRRHDRWRHGASLRKRRPVHPRELVASAGRYRASRRSPSATRGSYSMPARGSASSSFATVCSTDANSPTPAISIRNRTLERYGHHSPSAGVDVEPNATPYTRRPVDVLTGNITLRNCRMIGNLGGALLAGQVHGTENTIENVIVEACTMQASTVSQSRYGLIFDVPGGAITAARSTWPTRRHSSDGIRKAAQIRLSAATRFRAVAVLYS